MNEDFCRDLFLSPWRAGGAGGGFLLYGRLGMQVPPDRVEQAVERPTVQAFAALVYVALDDSDPIRDPQGPRHGPPKRRLLVASLIGTLKRPAEVPPNLL